MGVGSRIPVALVLLLAGFAARAQTALDPPDLGRYLRWGPVRVRPGLEITNLGYDDNILATETNKESDVTATVAPRLEGLVLFGDRAFLTFREQLELTGYLENTDQSYVNQRGEARATVPLRRIGLFVDGQLDRIKERPVDRVDVRTEQHRDGYGLGVILVPGWRTEIEIQQTRTSWEYTDPDDSGEVVPQRLNRTASGAALAARYRVRGRTRLTLDARLEELVFDAEISAGNDSRQWGVLPGIDFGEGGTLAGTVRIGWTEIDAESPALPDFAELVGDARLAYRPGSRTTFVFEAKREPGFAITGTSVYLLDTRYTLRGVRYLNRLVGLEAATTLGELTFPGSPGDSDRVDDIYRYEAGVRLRLAENSLGRRLEYGLRLVRDRRSSTEPGGDRSRTSIGFGAVFGF